MSKILVVDDEELIRWSLEQNLMTQGHEILTASTGEDALKITQEETPELIFLDLQLPGVSGMEVLQKVKEINKDIIVIIITATGVVETVVKAMKLGAYDYINKPFNLDELGMLVEKALETSRLRREVATLRAEQKDSFDPTHLVIGDRKMAQVMTMIKKIAKSDTTTVLITGESGTGKELAAKSIHALSARKEDPFIAINCAAMPENLLESELMGHEKGAFTDAKTVKKGLFEFSSDGTIFLDEIGDMPIGMQAKILRALEEKTIRRVGGSKDIKINVRVIAATNKNIKKAIEEGTFRRDLYYRLSVIPVELPPLRDRAGDIIPLAESFVRRFNREFNKDVQEISKIATRHLIEYSWPGNVRELKNVIERAIILENDEKIMPEHLPSEITTIRGCANSDAPDVKLPPEGVSMEAIEQELIRQALDVSGGNQSKAAKKLDLGIDAFRYRMKKFGYLN